MVPWSRQAYRFMGRKVCEETSVVSVGRKPEESMTFWLSEERGPRLDLGNRRRGLKGPREGSPPSPARMRKGAQGWENAEQI